MNSTQALIAIGEYAEQTTPMSLDMALASLADVIALLDPSDLEYQVLLEQHLQIGALLWNLRRDAEAKGLGR